MDLKRLGGRIKELRQKRRLRQADIAHALQISAQAVSKWERGENAPDITVLLELSRLLGVSTDRLLGGTSAETDTLTATVICTGITGFARMASEMAPRDVAAAANDVAYSVTEAVLAYDGVPVKYVGDGFLGFFSGSEHAQRALKAAKDARKRVRTRGGLVIVLNSGPIYLGTIGHPEYARPDIIGETVNTAFLAMTWTAEHCNGIGFVEAPMSEVPGLATMEFVGTTEVPQVERPLRIYQPQFVETGAR